MLHKKNQYAYQNQLYMTLEFTKEIDIQKMFEENIGDCNIYVEDLAFYFEEDKYTYLPEILLVQNEPLPYPTKKNTKVLQKGTVLAPTNVGVANGITIKNHFFSIADLIDTEECSYFNDYFVICASDYFSLYEEALKTKHYRIRIASNQHNVGDTYQKICAYLEKNDPKCKVQREEYTTVDNMFRGIYNEKTIQSMLIYFFAIINVCIISYYWIYLRKKEISIRKAYGFTNGQTLRLIMGEMLTIILFAIAISILLQIVVQVVNGRMMEFAHWCRMSVYYLGIITVSVMLSSLVPFFVICKIQPAEGIK